MGQKSVKYSANVCLTDIDCDSLMYIFDNISLYDLSNVSCTCKQLDRIVSLYLHSKCTDALLCNWIRFLSNHGNILTENEKKVRHIRFKEPLTKVDFYRLLNVTSQSSIVYYRVSLCDDAVSVLGKTNASHVKILSDKVLCRKIMHLDRVRWLLIRHSWSCEDPGYYRIGIRIRLECNFNWPHSVNQLTEWTLTYPSANKDIRKSVHTVNKGWWKQIWRKENPSSGPLRVIKDGMWMKILLPIVEVASVGTMSLEVRDSHCNFWKGGISFDFLEVQKVQ